MKKSRIVGGIFFIIIIAYLMMMVIAPNSNEKETKRIVENYYDALIDQDYEEVYNLSEIYDLHNASSDVTTLSAEEAKTFFMKKVEYLNKVNYKIIDYQITGQEQFDGHTFNYQVKAELEVSGENMKVSEKVRPKVDQNKVSISESEDPIVKYRDGSVGVDIDSLWQKDIGEN